MLVLDRLRAEQKIGAERYDAVRDYATRRSIRVEEAVLRVGGIEESDLLGFIAGLFGTRFVTTEKLARLRVSRGLLDRLPCRVAEQLDVFPIRYSSASNVFGVVAADVSDAGLAKQVQLVTGLPRVEVFVARPAAVHAAIRKHYYGDPQPFRQLVTTSGLSDVTTESVVGIPIRLDEPEAPFDAGELLRSSGAAREEAPAEPPAATDTRDADDDAAETPIPLERRLRRGKEGDEAADTGQGASPKREPASHTLPPDAVGLSAEGHLEMVKSFVMLLEQREGAARAHSAQVARMCRRLCDRMGLSAAQRYAITVAAYLHHIGKGSAEYTLSPLNVARYPEHRTMARASFRAPLRLFGASSLSPETAAAIEHMYECYGGGGFPDGLTGGDIPLGARILSVAATYVDLTMSKRNAYRRKLTPEQACGGLEERQGRLFDPTVVGLLSHLVLREDRGGVETMPRVLVVEADPEEAAALELRLIERGCAVTVARSVQMAAEAIAEGDVALVITELTIDRPHDGFELLEALHGEPATREVPVMVLTGESGQAHVLRAFELGVVDYVVKPAAAQVVSAKVTQVLEWAKRRQSGRGVSGSLQEMALPDVIQILAHGRKTGRLTVRNRDREGVVSFVEGEVYDAAYGTERGADAFYDILALVDGEFELDPTFRATTNVIQASTEALLLEAMRRFDERDRAHGSP